MYTFSQIYGHTRIIKSLQNAISNNKISHAYIINSEDEISRYMLANSFAKALLCETEGIESCNTCISCKAFEHKNNADVIYIDSEENKSIGVEAIRTKLVTDIEIRPYNSKYKIYIIKEADTMTEAAQNAILKTIEEPYKYAIIILITSNYKKLLTTVLSRCTILDLKPLSSNEVNKYIVDKEKAEEKNVDILTAYSQGNLSKLEEMINNEELNEFRKIAINTAKLFSSLDIKNILEIKQFFNINEKKYKEILDIIYLWYRDIAIVKNDVESNYILNKDKEAELIEEANKLSNNYVNRVLENIQFIRENLKNNINLKLATQVMLLNIRE